MAGLCGLALLFAQAAQAQVNVQSVNFGERWLDADETLVIRLDRLPEPSEGDLRLLVGHVDVTPLLAVSGGAEAGLVFEPQLLPLPRGESEVVLYLVRSGAAWEELARMPLRVRLPGGFETSEFNPVVNLSNKGQLEEDHFGDAPPPVRDTYQDIAGQLGFTSRHTRDDLEIRGSLNMIGSSVREEALRFGEKGAKAPKLDLSDYLVEIDKGRASVALGHITYGNHPLLINGVGNRGVRASYRLMEGVDVSVSSMNGTSIVGLSNLAGLESRDHNISAASVGVELLRSRPGGLRLEATYMDASIESLFNFDVGEVPDAETNRGFGLRLSGSNASGRLRGDFSIARSRYRNPNDPVLAQGDTLVEVKERSDMARHLELAYDLLQNVELGENLFVNVSLGLVHDRADPLYKSVAAFVQADNETNRVSLNAQLGQVSLALQYAESEDNLDDIPTILKTRTRARSLAVGMPLFLLAGHRQAPSFWWPTLSYNWNRTHQYAGNDPDPVLSGFNGGSHLPDQVVSGHTLGLQWYAERWSLEYRIALNDQDNRQVGRREADFELVTHDLNADLQLSDTLRLSANLALGRNKDQEQDLERETRGWGVNAEWRFLPQWVVSGSYSDTQQDDDRDFSENDDQTANAQLGWNTQLPFAGRKLPFQVFVRYAMQDSRNSDNLFGFESRQRTWTVNSGMSLSLF